MLNKWAKYWIISLLCVTALLLFWHRFGMQRTFVINEKNAVSITTNDDRDQGGESIATVEFRPDGMLLTCQLSHNYTWPFCGLSVYLGEAPHGVDFSNYESILLDIETDGLESKSVRVFLRNFNPAYSRPDNEMLLKANELHYVPKEEHAPFIAELKKFQVASWWLNEHHITPKYAEPEFNNILGIGVTFGDRLEPKLHRMLIKKIELHGKWITHQMLQSLILAFWILSALTYLALTYLRAYQAMQTMSNQKQELEAVNEALQLERNELETLATRDPLTGSYNRIALRNHLYPQLKRVKHKGLALTAMFIDLDGFKGINDRYGHDVGDEVLVEFSQLMTNNTRDKDFLCRWGGDEFILLCQGIDLEAATRLGEKLRKLVVEHDWPGNIALTCSFGIAQMDPKEDVTSFIKRADEALYIAKKSGRNCVAPSMAVTGINYADPSEINVLESRH